MTASNGTDVAACRAGTCQVQINGTADVTVHSTTVTVRVCGGELTLLTDFSRMSMGEGGVGKIGNVGGSAVVFRPTRIEGTTAVLDITTE